MHAQLVRPDRYGEPRDSIRDEVIEVPELGPTDALVLVMAAGVNFNNVWAARGVPVDVTKTQARWGEPTDFHIVGSDASGIVYAVGSEVSGLAVGDPRRRPRGTVGPRGPLGGRRERSRALPELPRLGLRHLLGLDGAVHQGAGASVPPEGGGTSHGRRRRPRR